MKVFAIPYAFGASYVYNDLKSKLAFDCEVIPIEYPGHGTRFGEELSHNIKELAVDAYNQICKKLLQDEEYAILGYSMGSIVGYELVKLLNESDQKKPECFFASASPAPSFKREKKNYECYDLEDIKEELDSKHGTPQEILDDIEILELLKPLVVNDMIALRDYHECCLNGKIEIPLVVTRGIGEQDTENLQESYEEWCRNFVGKTSYYEIQGGHFFMFESEQNLDECCRIIKDNLK